MIKPLFNTDQIRAKMAAKLEAVERSIVAILQRRGEQFVTDCRNERTYQDQTGNLRASIGYFIHKGNNLLISNGNSDAEKAVSGIGKDEGIYYLIGVAGMNYAAAVEAKGYNVISNQAIVIVNLLRGDLNSLQSKLNQ